MKIPNPWPRIPVRCTSKPGDLVSVQCVRGDLEVDEGAQEVLIEAIKDLGRGKYEVLAEGKIWSKVWGLQVLNDHLKKMKIEEDREALERERAKDAKRKAKEAKERGKVKKVVEEKPSVMDPPADMGKELEL